MAQDNFKRNLGFKPVDDGTLVDIIYRNGIVNYHVAVGEDEPNGSEIYTAEDWKIDNVDFDIVGWRLTEKGDTMKISTAQLQSMSAEARNAIRRLQGMRTNLECEIAMCKMLGQMIGEKVIDPRIYDVRQMLARANSNMVRIQKIIKDALKYGILTRSDAQRLEKHQTLALIGVQNDWGNHRDNGDRYTTKGHRALARLHRQIEIQRSIRKQLASM